ncbi:PRC-barrel domain protein [Jannaschia seosinensis]|uniref:PRC-barrel domain protein n=1 Tax=Jannaschia seosinensis TaxID=313367 RepID=A0A0M7B896_9RHOB|nr:PRC-barrel domain-containing protein [Jannaschia seosinensis]CUH33554.1 PRC-barrel domain protein [Jannaschia seosinensis]
MRPLHILSILTLPIIPMPASAQSLPDRQDVLSSATDVASEIADAAEDRLLIADILGREMIGADGNSIGTVENFVVLPGGNLVAAVIARKDGSRIALPWKAVQAGLAVEGSDITLPMSGEEIDGSEPLRKLTDSLDL